MRESAGFPATPSFWLSYVATVINQLVMRQSTTIATAKPDFATTPETSRLLGQEAEAWRRRSPSGGSSICGLINGNRRVPRRVTALHFWRSSSNARGCKMKTTTTLSMTAAIFRLFRTRGDGFSITAAPCGHIGGLGAGGAGNCRLAAQYRAQTHEIFQKKLKENRAMHELQASNARSFKSRASTNSAKRATEVLVGAAHARGNRRRAGARRRRSAARPCRTAKSGPARGSAPGSAGRAPGGAVDGRSAARPRLKSPDDAAGPLFARSGETGTQQGLAGSKRDLRRPPLSSPAGAVDRPHPSGGVSSA